MMDLDTVLGIFQGFMHATPYTVLDHDDVNVLPFI